MVWVAEPNEPTMPWAMSPSCPKKDPGFEDVERFPNTQLEKGFGEELESPASALAEASPHNRRSGEAGNRPGAPQATSPRGITRAPAPVTARKQGGP